jgi:voltage-gated potassium channel
VPLRIGVKLQSGPDAEPTFHSIPHSIWFIFVTMTTVGYGDVSPVSALGQVVNIFAMVGLYKLNPADP